VRRSVWTGPLSAPYCQALLPLIQWGDLRVSDLIVQFRQRRVALAVVTDGFAWIVAFGLFALLRFSDSAVVPWADILVFGLVAALLHAGLASAVRLHQGRARTASLEEALLLGAVTMTTGALLFFANLPFIWVPRSAPVASAFIALVLMGWSRAVWRRMVERETEAVRRTDESRRVVVVGAGEAGRELVSSMFRDPAAEWHPVALVDDDPHKRHLRLRGVPVQGRTDEIADVVEATLASAVVIAIPSADAATIARINAAALATGVEVKVLPASTQLLSEHVGIRDIRDINLTDVLGRNQLDTDVDAIAGYLTGRRVLVTGAGGSIGSELCRQIHGYAPAELMMLDRDESALHAVQLSIHGRALLDSNEVVLADIRDRDTVRRLFDARKPEVVFHAAALKHLPMLEQYPVEAVKTNILGTVNVLDAAREAGVERFVNISTDKAANPSSVLGYSKRVAERLTAGQAFDHEGTYLSVRFGNVLGSRGSVLTAFAKQIADGGPVTVTDAEVTRYFMTIEEACQLVIQAGAIGSPGEALVLDMGEPIRIVDVAEQLIAQSGRPVGIEFTGLRPGEKLHEELFADAEPQHVRPRHPLVSHVPVPTLEVGDIVRLAGERDPAEVRRAMAGLCLEWEAVRPT
jgi:FlaA1/EpsC-like NDP-sugar epimerase